MKMTQALQEAIVAIHAAPHKCVVELAGAGSQGLAWLHAVEGSSRTVLEAGDRYAAASLAQLIGLTPTRFTSPEVAQLMANQAFLRARALADDDTPVLGLGCTATIATDRQKKGAHRACVATRDERGGVVYVLNLEKDNGSRLEEERLVGVLLIQALANACGVNPSETGPVVPASSADPMKLLNWVLDHSPPWVAVHADGTLTAGQSLANVCVLSGSFNPLHEGHRRLALEAAKRLGQPVRFELSIDNADKATLSREEIERRAGQFAGEGTVLLTRAPLFGQKAEVFPHSAFVLGSDTAERLIQPRFYDNDPAKMEASLGAIKRAGCRFLVAGRQSGESFVTLDDLDVPERFRCLFEAIPEAEFREDISSAALREGGWENL